MDAPVIRKGQRAYALTDGMPDLQHWGMVISCSPYMVSKTQFSNRADERVDVKVREVVIRLDKSLEENQLVVGLPVDVYVETDELSGDS